MSKEWCRKKSESMKGKNNPFFGKTHNEETKKKLSLAHKGKKISPETIKKMIESRTGYKHSEETRKKISEGNSGKKKPYLSERNRINCKDKHPCWKGNDAKLSYDGIHYRMKLFIEKPEFCEMCHIKPPYDLANKSGQYLFDTNDWYYLCRSCHALTDERVYYIRPEKRIKKQ